MIPNTIFNQMIVTIITEQENVIGPLAVEQAKKVEGLEVNWNEKQISHKGDEKTIIDNLVGKYQKIFGKVSVEVCRHAVHKLVSQLPPDQQPALLK
jgi:hypothetical protein